MTAEKVDFTLPNGKKVKVSAKAVAAGAYSPPSAPTAEGGGDRRSGGAGLTGKDLEKAFEAFGRGFASTLQVQSPTGFLGYSPVEGQSEPQPAEGIEAPTTPAPEATTLSPAAEAEAEAAREGGPAAAPPTEPVSAEDSAKEAAATTHPTKKSPRK